MSNSTHSDIHFDVRAATAVTYLHLGEHSQVEAHAVARSAGSYVRLNLGGGHEPARVMAFVEDAGLLDRLIATLAQARADLVNEQLGGDLPKAG